jgi:putative FmdB family regulatory protein
MDCYTYRLEVVLMPTYEFRCDSDKTMIEIQQGFHDGNIPACPLCGNQMRKIIQATPAVFRGSGFYKTDNR